MKAPLKEIDFDAPPASLAVIVKVPDELDGSIIRLLNVTEPDDVDKDVDTPV
jgi:hypothetical protein